MAETIPKNVLASETANDSDVTSTTLSAAALMRGLIRNRFEQEGVLPSTVMRLRYLLDDTAIALDLNHMTILVERSRPGPGNTESHWIDGVPLDGEEETERVWRTDATRTVDTIFPSLEPEHKERRRSHVFGRLHTRHDRPEPELMPAIESATPQSASDIIRLFHWIDQAVLVAHDTGYTISTAE